MSHMTQILVIGVRVFSHLMHQNLVSGPRYSMMHFIHLYNIGTGIVSEKKKKKPGIIQTRYPLHLRT